MFKVIIYLKKGIKIRKKENRFRFRYPCPQENRIWNYLHALGALLWVESHCCHPRKTLDDSVSISNTSGTPWPRSIEFLFSHSLPWIHVSSSRNDKQGVQRGRNVISFSFFFSPFPLENPFRGAREPDSRDKQSALRSLRDLFPFCAKSSYSNLAYNMLDIRDRILSMNFTPVNSMIDSIRWNHSVWYKINVVVWTVDW